MSDMQKMSLLTWRRTYLICTWRWSLEYKQYVHAVTTAKRYLIGGVRIAASKFCLERLYQVRGLAKTDKRWEAVGTKTAGATYSR